MLTHLPEEHFGNLWKLRDDLIRVRVPTKLWREILLADLDRPIIHGEIRQLVGKRVGPGVYEITLAPREVDDPAGPTAMLVEGALKRSCEGKP